jgi:hypothetical protein
VSDIFKVIYSPVKAFKEILQNPRYRGAFLIMILFAAVYAASAYVVLSKAYYEQTIPPRNQSDLWTQNSTLWTSNANIAESSDAMTSEYFGNASIQFSLANNSLIWMAVNFTESVNCSTGGYGNMTFRIKVAEPDPAEVKNINLSLFSSPTDYFIYNLTNHVTLSNSTLWYNLTVPVGLGNDWTNESVNADWSNISSLKVEMSTLQNANWTVRFDGLFFRDGFESAIGGSATYVLSFAMIGVMLFVIRWILISGLLYVLVRALGGKALWKSLFVLVGFALITMFVTSTINIALYATLPTIRYSLEAIVGVPGESNVALSNVLQQTQLVSDVSYYIQIAAHVWSIILCAIIVRTTAELPWSKSAIAAVVAYLTGLLITSILLGY